MNFGSLSRRTFAATAITAAGAPAVARSMATPQAAHGSDLGVRDPGEVGVDPEAIDRIHQAVSARVMENQLAGAVLAISRHDTLIYHQAHGMRDVLSGDPMELDDLFVMMSSTKVVTAVAVMMAMEDGLLSIDDPVSRYIPWFEELTVAEPPEGFNLTRLNPDARTRAARQSRIVPADHQVTIKHILTHTAGFGTDGAGQWVIGNDLPMARTLRERVASLSGMELDFQPGSRWAYSPLHAFDVLLHIVELVSNQSAEEFVCQRILEPLGMVDTTFGVPASEQDRVTAVVFRINNDWVPLASIAELLSAGDDPALSAPPGADAETFGFAYPSGAAGLVSTAMDFLRFEQMLVNGGELNGSRVLSPKSVELLATDHVGDLYTGMFGVPSGSSSGFGLGVRVVTKSEGPESPAKGLFGWGGALGTETWADPKNGFAVSMLVHQIQPGLAQEIQGILNASVH